MASAFAGGFAQGFLDAKIRDELAQAKQAEQDKANEEAWKRLRWKAQQDKTLKQMDITAKEQERIYKRTREDRKNDTETLRNYNKIIYEFALENTDDGEITVAQLQNLVPPQDRWVLFPDNRPSGVKGLGLIDTKTFSKEQPYNAPLFLETGEIDPLVKRSFKTLEEIRNTKVKFPLSLPTIARKKQKEAKEIYDKLLDVFKTNPRIEVGSAYLPQSNYEKLKAAGYKFPVEIEGKTTYIVNQDYLDKQYTSNIRNDVKLWSQGKLTSDSMENRDDNYKKDFMTAAKIPFTADTFNSEWKKLVTFVKSRENKKAAAKEKGQQLIAEQEYRKRGYTLITTDESGKNWILPNRNDNNWQKKALGSFIQDAQRINTYMQTEQGSRFAAYLALKEINDQFSRVKNSPDDPVHKSIKNWLGTSQGKALVQAVTANSKENTVSFTVNDGNKITIYEKNLLSKGTKISSINDILEAYNSIADKPISRDNARTDTVDSNKQQINSLAQTLGIDPDKASSLIRQGVIVTKFRDRDTSPHKNAGQAAGDSGPEIIYEIKDMSLIKGETQPIDEAQYVRHYTKDGEEITAPYLADNEKVNTPSFNTTVSLYLSYMKGIPYASDVLSQQQVQELTNQYKNDGTFAILTDVLKNPTDAEKIDTALNLVSKIEEIPDSPERRNELLTSFIQNLFHLKVNQSAKIIRGSDGKIFSRILWTPPEKGTPAAAEQKTLNSNSDQLGKVGIQMKQLEGSLRNYGAITQARRIAGSKASKKLILNLAQNLINAANSEQNFKVLKEKGINFEGTYKQFRNILEGTAAGEATGTPVQTVGRWHGLLTTLTKAVSFGKSLINMQPLTGMNDIRSIADLRTKARKNAGNIDSVNEGILDRIERFDRNREKFYNDNYAKLSNAYENAETDEQKAAVELQMMQLHELGRIQNLQISLTYYYAGMVQGSSGGRAISNEDFQNIYKALWSGGVGGPMAQGSFQQVRDIIDGIKLRNMVQRQAIGYPNQQNVTEYMTSLTNSITKARFKRIHGIDMGASIKDYRGKFIESTATPSTAGSGISNNAQFKMGAREYTISANTDISANAFNSIVNNITEAGRNVLKGLSADVKKNKDKLLNISGIPKEQDKIIRGIVNNKDTRTLAEGLNIKMGEEIYNMGKLFDDIAERPNDITTLDRQLLAPFIQEAVRAVYTGGN